MPSADAARPGAERRARAAARARLAEVLRTLPLGGGRHLDEAGITRAVEHARAVSVDYQSNGGALVRMEVRFGAWTDPAAESPSRLMPPSRERPAPQRHRSRLTRP